MPGAQPFAIMLRGRRVMPALAAASLLFACSPAGPRDTRTVTVDRGAYDAAISPDGSTIALGVLGGIRLLSAAGGEARQLTSGHGWDHHPAWSADGEHLAYVHDAPAASEIRQPAGTDPRSGEGALVVQNGRL